MSKLCPTCQTANTDESRYCYRCGTALSAPGPVAPAVPTPAAPLPPLSGETPARVVATPGMPPLPPGLSGAPVAPPLPDGMSGAPVAPPWAAGPAPAWPGGAPPPVSPPTAPLPVPPQAGAWRTLPPVAPAPRRPWLALGVALIGGGVLLVLLAAVAGLALLRGNGVLSGRTGSAPSGSLEAGLRAAVDASNQAQIQALRSLDTAPLQGAVIGKALDDNQQLLDDLRQHHLYAVSELQKIEYRAPKQIDATHATIRTLESWTTRYYDLTSKRLVRQTVSTGLDEIYYLAWQDNKWIVEQIDIRDPNATPGPDTIQ